ncbi:MAG: DUF2336 domain-containing protein [Rhodospirillales bacterium]
MLNWVFGNIGKRKKKRRSEKRPKGDKPVYEEAKRIAEKGTVEERRDLATHEDLEPEILYYFTGDEASEVRREVANNPGTPLQADLILARDKSDEVRMELARKIGQLVPELPREQNKRLAEMALEILEILANDQLPMVRAIIADELKHSKNVPRRMVERLASDMEEIVSCPILEFSPLLSKQSLLEIVASGISGGALQAISRRKNLDAAISDAVYETGDSTAVETLLDNETARIHAKTMDKIADEAQRHANWHLPMVKRDDLTPKTIRRIATFVSRSLLDTLIKRNNVNETLVREIRQTVRKRIERGDAEDDSPSLVTAQERAKKMFDAGELNEGVIMISAKNRELAFIHHALALMSGLPYEAVQKMLNTPSGKGVTALSYKAGLSMKACEELQKRIARVPMKHMVLSKLDGSYPMNEDDIDWYLDFFL